MPIAVVTGAASGIGAACARMLTVAGYTVTGIDLQPAPDCASSFEVDVADADAVETLFAAVERDLGQVDAVVTAAGFYEWVPLFDLDEAMVDRAVDVLLSGTANVCRAALRRMIPRAHGAICTIGSELGLTGDADAVHYAMCKGAVHALTKTMALEAAPCGVRVNCVAPGPTDTPMLKPHMKTPDYIASLVLQRLVDPNEIAAMVAFVLDSDQHNLVGQVISPNAGAVI